MTYSIIILIIIIGVGRPFVKCVGRMLIFNKDCYILIFKFSQRNVTKQENFQPE